jgi:antitoxin VapB
LQAILLRPYQKGQKAESKELAGDLANSCLSNVLRIYSDIEYIRKEFHMPLSIRNKETEALARLVAKTTGESLTEAIQHALEDRLARIQGKRTEQDLAEQILDIARRCGAFPDLDTRPTDEILGYRQDGTMS